MNLQNKVAVVTGASRGLGKHFSTQLIEKGAIVFGLARNEADLNGVRNELGEHFHPIVCDVTDPDAVKRAFSTIQESTDSLDILINNAGLGRFGAVEEQSLDDWNLQIDVNISGVHHCTRGCACHEGAEQTKRLRRTYRQHCVGGGTGRERGP